jgi:hypothetical protein
VAAWSNAAAAVGVGAGCFWLFRSWILALVACIVTFAGLRLALAHRVTVWFAASFGTLAVAAVGGGFAWLFAHLLEAPQLPSIAAVFGAVLSATVPAWSYARLALRRAEHVPDSLIDPVSVPSSRD